MSKDDIDSIKTITFIEAIRLRPWMYVGEPYSYSGEPKNLLSTIIGIFAQSFLSLGVSEFTIGETQNFFLIKSKQDWLKNKHNRDVEYYFREGTTGRVMAEPFLPAFYFPFYTRGEIGELGQKKLLGEYFAQEGADDLEAYGRFLVVLKEQHLPEGHGIVFERPKQSIDDLQNEKLWLEAAIQSSKLKQ